MSPREPRETPTRLLRRYTGGDSRAGELLATRIQRELDVIWEGCLSRGNVETAVHGPSWIDSIYVKQIFTTQVDWRDRNAYYGIGAELLHDLLSDPDHREAIKPLILIDEWKLSARHRFPVSRFLAELQSEYLTKEGRDDVLVLRMHAGLSVEAMAQVLNRKIREIHRAWRSARNYLRRHYVEEDES